MQPRLHPTYFARSDLFDSMAYSWQSFRVLKSPQYNIAFQDFTSLWQHCVIVYDDEKVVRNEKSAKSKAKDQKTDVLMRVQAIGSWGKQLMQIAHKTISDLEKNREVAQLCWCSYCTARFGQAEAGGEHPWENESAKVWKDEVPCPAAASKMKVPASSGGIILGHGKDPYPKVILGKQHWVTPSGEKYSKPFSLRLHRYACWLAGGNPSAELSLATHHCGHKQCLRLGCLKWGNHKTNHDDAQRLAEQLGKLTLGRKG